MTAYDPRTGDWKQVYVTNQVPGTSGLPSLAEYAKDGYSVLTF